MIKKQKKYVLPENLQNKIDENLKKYPSDHRQSAILYALRLTQNDNGGWIREQHMRAVADYLKIDYIAVYEVATFYSMLKLKPVGKSLVSVCDNISCKLKGADNLLSFIEEYLQIKTGETTSDGLITLERAECLGACVNAPSMIVNDEYQENLTKDKVQQILDNLSNGDNH